MKILSASQEKSRDRNNLPYQVLSKFKKTVIQNEKPYQFKTNYCSETKEV